jgi:hypothetical protein
MASTRPERKSSLVAVLTRLGLGIALGLAPSQPEHAAATERIVTDWHTGLALYGFDPVAYFTDATANVGKPDFEYTYEGVIWWRIRPDCPVARGAHTRQSPALADCRAALIPVPR